MTYHPLCICGYSVLFRKNTRVISVMPCRHKNEASLTTFYLACLLNRGSSSDPHARPRFHITGRVERPYISIQDVRYLNDYGKLHQVPFPRSRTEMEVRVDLPHLDQPTELFKRLVAVEVIGAGFDRPPNA